MSAFLGPIHSWLFNKIVLQNELTERFINKFEKEGYVKDLGSFLDRKIGKLEEGELPDIIDQNNIHGWLQERVNLVENRLAAAVSHILKEKSELLTYIIDEAYKFGEDHAINNEMNPKEIYQYMDSIFINGMPCDHVNILTLVSDTLISWEQKMDIHKSYWDRANTDVEYYYDIKNAIIKGILSGLSVSYAKTGTNQYEIRVK